jgi:hypothetical protein
MMSVYVNLQRVRLSGDLTSLPFGYLVDTLNKMLWIQ